MAPANDLRSRVDSFVADLNDLIRKSALDAVHSALGMTAKRGPGRPRGAAPVARKGRRVKRDPKAVMEVAAKVLAAAKAKPGSSIEQLGAALKMPTKSLALPVRKLIAAKQLKTRGQKRGTRYFAG